MIVAGLYNVYTASPPDKSRSIYKTYPLRKQEMASSMMKSSCGGLVTETWGRFERFMTGTATSSIQQCCVLYGMRKRQRIWCKKSFCEYGVSLTATWPRAGGSSHG